MLLFLIAYGMFFQSATHIVPALEDLAAGVLVERSDTDAIESRDRVKEWATSIIKQFQNDRPPVDPVVAVCQAISNRYYFETQGDRRTITTSRTSDWWRWDWCYHTDSGFRLVFRGQPRLSPIVPSCSDGCY